jgi:hypothetical protein
VCLFTFIACFYLKKIKKFKGEDVGILFSLFYFYLPYQILHVFLPDISVLCALIDYAYI